MARSALKQLQQCLRLSAIAGVTALSSGCFLDGLWELRTTQISDTAQAQLPPPEFSTKTIPVDLPNTFDRSGALIAADVDGDQQRDIIITQPGYIGAYSLTKGKLWDRDVDIWVTGKSESNGLPGLHGPGIQAGDIDQDGILEILYLNDNNELQVLSGDTGITKYQIELPPVDASKGQWEHAVIANFRGEGDTDLLLQASQETNQEGYIRDNVQAAFRIEELLTLGQEAQPLWSNDSFVSLSHGSAKVADIDGDGKDEVVGAMVLGSEGQALHNPGMKNTSFPHIDSVGIDDIDPNRPGLEIVIPEESGDKRVMLFDDKGTLWTSEHRRRAEDGDGDKVAIGNFDPTSPGLESWFRGNESRHFTVLNAAGDVISSYKFSDRRPDSWTEKGFEVITRIRWTGEEKEYIVAKERHEAGDVGIFDAMTGQLVTQFPNQTERLYVADVLGDWREEIIVLSNDELTVYQNEQTNPNPSRSSLWNDNLYRRQKMTWNYYSP